MGALPEPGKWTTLSFDPAVLEIGPGSRLATLSVQMVGGRVAWDRCAVKGELSPAKDPLASFALWWKSHDKRTPADLPGPLAKTLADGPDKTTDTKARETLLAFYLRRIAHPAGGSAAAPRRAWEEARVAVAAADEAIPTTFIFNDLPEPRETFIAERGQYNKPGEKVEPAIPANFGPFNAPKEPRRLNRLDLANWLVAPEHPLTARVTVNRFWQQVFGTGLVKTSHDLGSQGEPPSHPELLDWLAVTFRESGWDMKQFVKLLVTSHTYRQSAQFSVNSAQSDPENRLLARGPRFRLDAEVVRDSALFVSSLLNPKIGGKGVRPYQPENIWEPVAFGGSNTKNYIQDHGESLYRRSLYTFWKRTAPPPNMTSFDAPNRESYCLRRERSNTPLQALTLMNDVQFFEAARAFAEQAMKTSTSTDARITRLFRAATSRFPSAQEAEVIRQTFDKHLAAYTAKPEEAKKVITNGESKPDASLNPVELASWTMIANLVLNLDEAVTK
jgi:hypothetical protein